MNLDQLNKTAEAMVKPGKGILAADEFGTIKKRFDAIGVESTADNRRDYRELLFRSTDAMRNYISGVILYDETIRQRRRTARPLVKLIETGRRDPRHQGRRRRQAAAALARRDGHRGPRRPARAAEGLPRPRRPLREVARRDRHRRRQAELRRDPRQRPRPRPLRGPVPGGRHRADRRARGADGRRPRHRDLRPGHRVGAEGGLPAALLPERRARRHGAEAQHGRPRQEVRRSRPRSTRSPSARSRC